MGVKEVQLTSKSHLDNVLASVNELRLQGHLSDVTVKIDDQGAVHEFQAHRLMLAASSGYFKGIVLSEDEAQDKLLLTNMNSSDFSKFLEFVYTGKVQVNRKKIGDVQAIAQFLDCKDLLEVCQETMSAGVLQKHKRAADDEQQRRRRSKRKKLKHSSSKTLHSSQDTDISSKQLKTTNKVKGKKLKLRLRHKVVKNTTQMAQGTCENKAVNRDNEAELQDGRGPKDTLLSDSDEWQLKDSSLSNDDEDSFLLFLGGEEDEDDDQDEETFKRTSKAQFECNKCQRTFHYEKSYLKHISTYHGVTADVIYRCDTCQQTFANRSNLKTHERHVHSSEREFSCSTCAKAFKRKKDVVRHQRQVHERSNQENVCTVCGKSLSCKAALLLHERIHTGTKPFECTLCGARFTQKSALKMHSRTHTGEKPFACDKCDARFTQKHMLAYHTRSHTGEKPFMCEACGKSFSSREYLRHHSNIHTGIKPFKCEHCDRGFAQRNSLNQHLKIHTGERPYRCAFCEKHFTQLNALQRHQRIHTGEKPFMCGLCNRTFTDKSTLRRHTTTHASDAPWKSYLVVLEGNVEDKKNQTVTKSKTPKAGPGEKKSKKTSTAVKDNANKTQSDPMEGSAEPVTVPTDWASHGAIAVVSHSALGGITVIHTELPPGTQLQPIVTTDSTGASVLSLDSSAITVPFSIAASVAQSIPLSSEAPTSSMSVPTVSVSHGTLAIVSQSPTDCTPSVLEAAASETILAPDSKTEGFEADMQSVMVTDTCCEIQEMVTIENDAKKATDSQET